jgi:CheY-specific phosphatase CheX
MTETLRHPFARLHHGLRVGAAGLLLLFPEITVGLLLFDAARHTAKAAQVRRLDGEDPERGDAIQWVIVTAIGAAIAVTVGAIIFNKLENKANNIDVTTPGAR